MKDALKIEEHDGKIFVMPKTQADRELIIDMIEKADLKELTYLSYSDRWVFSQADWDKIIKAIGNI